MFCDTQDVPPSVVAMIVPPAPTAKQSELVGQETPERVWDVGDVGVAQFWPASVVVAINPVGETSTQSAVVEQEIALSEPKFWN